METCADKALAIIKMREHCKAEKALGPVLFLPYNVWYNMTKGRRGLAQEMVHFPFLCFVKQLKLRGFQYDGKPDTAYFDPIQAGLVNGSSWGCEKTLER